jgi:alpha-L-rhamnosidase
VGDLLAEGDSMVSFNHYAYGAVAAWLYRTVAGLVIDLSSAGQQITMAPKPGGGLAWAEAGVDTPYGLAAIRWEEHNTELIVEIEIPAGVRARFESPAGYRPKNAALPTSLGSGKHTIVLVKLGANAIRA